MDGVIAFFTNIFFAGMFGVVGVPMVLVVAGKKYAYPSAVVGVVWLVTAIIIRFV